MAESDYAAYPMFKGLQRPLELFGLQGRYITWAAVAAGIGLVLFIILYVSTGFLVGLAGLFSVLGVAGVIIMIKQKRGLHTKKIYKGIFVMARTKSI